MLLNSFITEVSGIINEVFVRETVSC
jgi:hypothetical protein